jgi:hypothetical protein
VSRYTDHRGIKKQLKAVQERANRGIHTHDDLRTLVNTIIKLTDMVYKPLIEEEKANERRD